MPVHNHAGTSTSATLSGALNIPNGADVGQPTYYQASGIVSVTGNSGYRGNASDHGAGGHIQINAPHAHTISVGQSGKNASHNNIQPFLVCYMFKRTA